MVLLRWPTGSQPPLTVFSSTFFRRAVKGVLPHKQGRRTPQSSPKIRAFGDHSDQRRRSQFAQRVSPQDKIARVDHTIAVAIGREVATKAAEVLLPRLIVV